MGINKIEYGGKVLIDLTEDTVTEDTLLAGMTAHDAAGNQITGTAAAGIQLNFEIVGGTTEPTNPKENTIWVNTDTEITDWAFSHSEPTNPIDGMVWIQTKAFSSVSFNVVTEKYIECLPASIYQYVSNAWVNRESMIYQSSQWVSWINNFVIYEDGCKNIDVTGGLNIVAASGMETVLNPDGDISFTIVSSYAREAAIYTVNKVDVSRFSTLKARAQILATQTTSASSAGFYIGLANDVGNSYPYPSLVARTYKNSVGTFDFSVDVSKLTGSYYIVIGSDVVTGVVNNVRLEG